MKYRDYKDTELLSKIKSMVQTERDLLVQILDLLREIDRRRLYSDLGYRSLFEYAVQELRYSEGQASRRIQAMRLIKETPEVEAKIASGELSLTNVQQAQSEFRDMQQTHPQRVVSVEEKRAMLSFLMRCRILVRPLLAPNALAKNARLLRQHPKTMTPPL